MSIRIRAVEKSVENHRYVPRRHAVKLRVCLSDVWFSCRYEREEERL